MSYKRHYTRKVEKEILAEWRGRIKQSQKDQLKDLEDRLHIPQAAIIRIALDCFLPKLSNMEVTETGMLNVWNREKF